MDTQLMDPDLIREALARQAERAPDTASVMASIWPSRPPTSA